MNQEPAFGRIVRFQVPRGSPDIQIRPPIQQEPPRAVWHNFIGKLLLESIEKDLRWANRSTLLYFRNCN
jgi:hypothetical protein